MSLGELQLYADGTSIWEAIIWCLFPMSILLIIGFHTSGVDDDDDQGGGMMQPAYRTIQNP